MCELLQKQTQTLFPHQATSSQMTRALECVLIKAVLSRAAQQTYLWNLKIFFFKKELGGTPNAESEFRRTGFGQECFLHPAASY